MAKTLNRRSISTFVEAHIGDFHIARLQGLSALQLDRVLLRKNPYLPRAKNVLTAQELVQSLLDAHLSSQEETMFGHFLEALAVFVCGEVFGGRKSSAEGIDLEFETARERYIVSIKSGPNWGNSRQIAKMRDDFKKARRIIGREQSGKSIIAVNGCCYGRDRQPDKDDYFKYCGQSFWALISGDERLYVDIIEPLGHRAKERNDDFMKAYAKIINTFTQRFIEQFCVGGAIDWEKLVRFNSGRTP